jgi:chemotaxis response regulator CheB
MKEIIEQLLTEIKARLEVENAKEYDEATAVDDLITISFLNGGRVALQSVLQAMEARVVK